MDKILRFVYKVYKSTAPFRFLMKAKYSYWPFSVFGEIPLDNFPNEFRKFVVCLQEDYAISIRIDRSTEVI